MQPIRFASHRPHKRELMGVRVRRATFDAIKQFYEENRRKLPDLIRSDLKKIFQAIELDERRAREMKKPLSPKFKEENE